MALTIVEEACAFFDGCHRSTASDRDVLYYIGVLLCAQYGQLVELNAPAMQAPVTEPVPKVDELQQGEMQL